MQLTGHFRKWIFGGLPTAILITVLVLAASVACSGGGDDEGTVTATPANAATATRQAVVAATRRADSTPTPANQATATQQAVVAATRQAGATATSSPRALPTATPPTSATPTAAPFPTAQPIPTSTPTPTPTNAVARAGNDIDTRVGNFIGLNASGSSDPNGDPLTFEWTQIHGPDVTGGAGRFIGATPSFAVPLTVSTLIFELAVTDGKGIPDTDTVQINVFEHVGNPGLFVDGNSGSDETGDGTREYPFATVGFAIQSINGPNQDIHVMSMADDSAYWEPFTLTLPTTTSMYGGYGEGWVRDIEDNKTRIDGAPTAIHFSSVGEPAWFSGFVVSARDASTPGTSTHALKVDGGGSTLLVEDNIFTAGNAGSAQGDTGAGSSHGLFIGTVFNIEIRRNEITAGNGGEGVAGPKGADGTAGKSDGANGKDGEDGGTRGLGGEGGNSTINGGRGGNGGGGLIPTAGGSGGNGGGPGGAGGIGDEVGEGRVGDGSGGGGGAGGNGGDGGSGSGRFDANGRFFPGNGARGENAGNGGGGGGGGGGGTGGAGLTGGGGGGGGGGGTGGAGGTGGSGGGASIGIALFSPVTSLIEDNVITSGNGGNGGNGGAGGTGAAGKKGGVGGGPQCVFLGCDVGRSGDGGEGGGGGSGGIGGQGGGGAGGPSFGIAIAPEINPVIRNSVVRSGIGGNGGIGGAAGLGGASGGGGGSTGGPGGCCSFLLETAGVAGTGGGGGWSYAIYDADPNDDDSPTITGTQLQAGAPGTGRAINGTVGKSGQTNLQATNSK